MNKFVDFSHPIAPEAEMSNAEIFPDVLVDQVFSISSDGFNAQSIRVASHTGTHVDAPYHFLEDGDTIDDLPIDSFVGEGIILDVSKEEPAEITPREMSEASGTVHVGDIVVLYTGWYHRWATDRYRPHPWLTTDGARWLLERGAKLVAVDLVTPDLPLAFRDDDFDFPVHRELLSEGVLIAEHLTNLEAYTGVRMEMFCLPLKIKQGDGSPVRFVGRLE